MNENPLPNTIPGAVCAQYRHRNGKRYGPYYFRFWRERGRLRKQYVPLDQAELVRGLCLAHRLMHAREKEEIAQSMGSLRSIRELIREIGRGCA